MNRPGDGLADMHALLAEIDAERTANGAKLRGHLLERDTAVDVGLGGLVTTCLADVRPEPVRFLVPGVIPLKLVTIAGLGGAGKGMFLASLAADLTRGRPSLGLPGVAVPPCDVLMLGCEDGYADTIVPRLWAADADMDRVHAINGVRDLDGDVMPFSLADLSPLDAFLETHPNVRLVTLDSISGYVGRAGISENKDAEIRTILEPLSEIANNRHVTIVAVKHLNKDEAKSLASRVGGSGAYVNTPRACFVVGADPGDKSRRAFALFKTNLNIQLPPTIAWIQEPVPADRVAAILAKCEHLDEDAKSQLRGQLFQLKWVGPIQLGSDDLLGSSTRAAGKADVDRASEWLRARLADGPVGSNLCVSEGNRVLGLALPLGKWRVSVLKDRLSGKSRKAGMDGPWFFTLPEGPWPPSVEAVTAAQQAAPGEGSEEHEELEETATARTAFFEGPAEEVPKNLPGAYTQEPTSSNSSGSSKVKKNPETITLRVVDPVVSEPLVESPVSERVDPAPTPPVVDPATTPVKGSGRPRRAPVSIADLFVGRAAATNGHDPSRPGG